MEASEQKPTPWRLNGPVSIPLLITILVAILGPVGLLLRNITQSIDKVEKRIMLVEEEAQVWRERVLPLDTAQSDYSITTASFQALLWSKIFPDMPYPERLNPPRVKP